MSAALASIETGPTVQSINAKAMKQRRAGESGRLHVTYAIQKQDRVCTIICSTKDNSLFRMTYTCRSRTEVEKTKAQLQFKVERKEHWQQCL